MPAPSAMTKPSRWASKGREAEAGSSLRVLIARIKAKAPKAKGDKGHSTAPANMVVVSPRAIRRAASPTAMAPEAQEFALAMLGPWVPNSMAILQDEAPPKTEIARVGRTARKPF